MGRFHAGLSRRDTSWGEGEVWTDILPTGSARQPELLERNVVLWKGGGWRRSPQEKFLKVTPFDLARNVTNVLFYISIVFERHEEGAVLGSKGEYLCSLTVAVPRGQLIHVRGF